MGPRAPERSTPLTYLLRPPLAQERVTEGPDGLVRIVLKPGRQTVRYAGVLASASKLRPRIVPPRATGEGRQEAGEGSEPRSSVRGGCRSRSWAELLGTLGIDAFACPSCKGRMRLLARVRAEDEVRRFLRALGEAT